MNDRARSTAVPSSRHRAWLKERVLVDGDASLARRAQEWADALGAECVVAQRGASSASADPRMLRVSRTFRPARVEARLVVVDANAGHIRWRVRRTRSPMLVVRQRGNAGRVVVAVDLRDPSESVLSFVWQLAQKQPLQVTLVQSIAAERDQSEWMANLGGSMGDFVTADMTGRKQSVERRLAELLERFQLTGDVRVSESPPDKLIITIAEELGADLVAIGLPRLREDIAPLFHRTLADEVAATAPCSVLVVPHPLHIVDES